MKKNIKKDQSGRIRISDPHFKRFLDDKKEEKKNGRRRLETYEEVIKRLVKYKGLKNNELTGYD